MGRPLPHVPQDTWFHDVFDEMGAPHDPAEVDFLRLLTAIDDADRAMAA
jgi:hypothetical protein